MPNILAAFKKHCPQVAASTGSVLRPGSVDTVLPMKTAADLQMWEKLDDVIMVGDESSLRNILGPSMTVTSCAERHQ
jgi:hypothetical protein